MDIRFRHVDEKDIDLLVMDRAATGSRLLQLLIGEVADEIDGDPATYGLVGARHSATTRNGESGLILILSNGERTHALLLEDKIDAPPQYRQASRYKLRGDEGMNTGDWDAYSVILIAPQGYMDGNHEEYPHAVSYQDLRDALDAGDDFGRSLLSDAISKQRQGWQPNRSETMTGFYDKVADTAKRMRIKAKCTHKTGQDRAEYTAWVYFSSPLAVTSICWKSNQGLVALCISRWGGKEDVLKERVGEIPEGWYWRKWDGKVQTAFLCVDALKPVTNWAEATEDEQLIEDALRKVQAVYDFARELNNRVINWEP